MISLFVSWCVSQVVFLLIAYRINKSWISAYSIATLVYFGSYGYPYLYYLGVTSKPFNESLTQYEFSYAAFLSFVIFKSVVDVFYLICSALIRKKNCIYEKLTIYNNLQAYKINGGVGRIFSLPLFLILFVAILSGFFLSSGGVVEFLNPVTRFKSNGFEVASYLYLISLLLLMVSAYLHYNLRPGRISVLLMFFLAIIYPVTIAGRAVVLPFVLVLAIRYLSGRDISFPRFITFFCLISVLYINSLTVRNSDLGVLAYLSKIPESASDLFLILEYFFGSVSGFATTTLTLSGLADGQIATRPSPILYWLYISPLPSFVLPTDSFVEYQSLSKHFGFTIGINSDIISESILWFGSFGVIVNGLLLGYATYFTDMRSVKMNILSKALFFGYIYMILLSNIASIRASSRLFVCVITIMIFRSLLVYLTREIRKASDDR